SDLRRTGRAVGMFRLAPLHRSFSRAGLTERPLPDTRPDLWHCSKGFLYPDVRQPHRVIATVTSPRTVRSSASSVRREANRSRRTRQTTHRFDSMLAVGTACVNPAFI